MFNCQRNSQFAGKIICTSCIKNKVYEIKGKTFINKKEKTTEKMIRLKNEKY